MPHRRLVAVVRRNLPAILSVVVFVGALWWWADRLDFMEIARRLRMIDSFFAAISFLALLGFPVLNAARLVAVTRWVADTRVTYPAALRLTCLSAFIAVTAPIGLVGDAAKVALMRPIVMLSWRNAIQCVFGDRASGALFVAGFGLLSLPARWLLETSSGLGLELAVFVLVLGGTWIMVRISPRLLQVSRRMWDIPASILSAVASLFQGWSRLAAQAGFALANIGLTLAATFFLARGMSVQVGALQLLQFVPIIILVTSLPLLYLGWGGRELVMVSTAGALPGISASEVVSLSIALGLLTMLAALPNAVFLLTRWRGLPEQRP